MNKCCFVDVSDKFNYVKYIYDSSKLCSYRLLEIWTSSDINPHICPCAKYLDDHDILQYVSFLLSSLMYEFNSLSDMIENLFSLHK